MTYTTRPATGRTTFHRDGTITIWDCFARQWLRGDNPSDLLLSTCDDKERARIIRHTGLEVAA